MKYFKLPIEYIDHNTISNIIKNDVEMEKLYENILEQSELSKHWCNFYTTNTEYLKETQKLIKNHNIKLFDTNIMLEKFKIFKQQQHFNDVYQYINFDKINYLNYSIPLMQILAIYNLISPALSIITPIFMLIIPFFILKLKNIDISGDLYKKILYDTIKRTNIFKLFHSNENLSIQQKMSCFMTILFYIFQIYQNILSCIQFYKNIHYIYDFIFSYRDYCTQCKEQLIEMNKSMDIYNYYSDFIEQNNIYIELFDKIIKKTNYILPYKNTLSRLTQIGYVMTIFYDLYYNEKYNELFYYGYYTNEYNKNILSLQKLNKQQKINKCKFEKKSTYFKENYYLFHYKDKYITNNINLDTNIILTGPNASGKTTLLKSILLNIILSQQIGYGAYKKANVNVYNYLHSYLNIPDTSDRDSLFQAEARRCKDILEDIHINKESRHFCIFDELYSGTNPNDAVYCAKLYLKALNQRKNKVNFILTTHYSDLCDYFQEEKYNKEIKNIKMDVEIKDENIKYLYKVEEGISKVHGGKKILIDLNYPSYIFNL